MIIINHFDEKENRIAQPAKGRILGGTIDNQDNSSFCYPDKRDRELNSVCRKTNLFCNPF